MARNDLPYYNSQTQPHLAKNRIHRILEKFGVDQINLSENFRTNEVRVSFTYENIPVSIPVNIRALAELYEESNWESIPEVRIKKAKNAAFAIIEDYLKAMLTMHELNIMSTAEIFMPNLVGKGGVRLGEMIANQLPDFLEGKKLLGDGQ